MEIEVGSRVKLKDLNLEGVVRAIDFNHVDVAVNGVTYTYYIENVELIAPELPPLGVSVSDGIGVGERLG